MPSNGVKNVHMIWGLTYLRGCDKWRNVTHICVEKDADANQAERDITILEAINNREHLEGVKLTTRNTSLAPSRHHFRADHANATSSSLYGQSMSPAKSMVNTDNSQSDQKIICIKCACSNDELVD